MFHKFVLFTAVTFLISVVGTSALEAQPSGGPLGFLQRLDANGNGTLEPSEQGRARPFLERIARDVGGIDLNRPIPLSTIGQKLEQMQRGQSGQGGSSRDRSRGGSSQPRDMQGNPLAPAAPLDTLVPGFDIVEDVLGVPGFGAKAEYLNVPVKEEDFTEADQTIKRYDRNRNGILEADEIRAGRWRDDPSKQDRNGDGKLTRSELAVRYSIRRSDEAARKAQSSGNPQSSDNSRSSSNNSRGSSQQPQSRSRGSSSGGSPGGSRWGGGGGDSGGADRMAQFAGSILQRYDSNKSGVIEKDEWKNFRSDPSAADTNKDNKITKDELGKWMSSRFSQSRGGEGQSGGAGSSRGGSRGSSGGNSGGSGEDVAGNGSYRFRLPQEGLPEGLPKWYRDRDTNRDGQIAMSEYTGEWTEKTLAEYYAYDANRDGIVTPAEALETTEGGFVRGVSQPPSSSKRGSSESSDSKPSAGPGEPDAKFVSFAVRTIAKYDENKNGYLDGEEVSTGVSKSSMIKTTSDANSDGKITPKELAISLMPKG
ncbi:MAG: hypothetical protein VX738_06310 [Planctomycetota bacterium]|nr:hypothetical protein [Planctomycetota bacterium]